METGVLTTEDQSGPIAPEVTSVEDVSEPVPEEAEEKQASLNKDHPIFHLARTSFNFPSSKVNHTGSSGLHRHR